MTQLAYILAASHSGSTLLAMLVNAHPQVCSVGELKLKATHLGDPDHYRCSCGEFIQACRFWTKVRKGMAARGHEFDIADAGIDYGSVDSQYARWLLGPLHRGVLLESLRDGALTISPTWRRRLPEVHDRNAALASTVADITKAQVIVDSSKRALRLKYLLRNPELEVKVIRLIRDGHGVALTYMDTARFADAKDPSLRAGGTGGGQKHIKLTMAQAAYQWKANNEDAENALRRLDKSQWIEVRYEELCKDTENTLSRLFEFFRVDPGKRTRNFRTVEHHVIGNGMRLDTTSEVRLDERWRSILTEDDLRVFDLVAGKVNRRYGYE